MSVKERRKELRRDAIGIGKISVIFGLIAVILFQKAIISGGIIFGIIFLIGILSAIAEYTDVEDKIKQMIIYSRSGNQKFDLE